LLQGVEWVNLTEDKNIWRAFVSMLMNLLVP
jgi:hypothetical protein